MRFSLGSGRRRCGNQMLVSSRCSQGLDTGLGLLAPYCRYLPCMLVLIW